jgi:hypothetical protein
MYREVRERADIRERDESSWTACMMFEKKKKKKKKNVYDV